MILTHHNQSHATYYTYLRFHTSLDSLKIRCYNRYIQTDFYIHSLSSKDGRSMTQDIKSKVAQGRATYDIYIEID